MRTLLSISSKMTKSDLIACCVLVIVVLVSIFKKPLLSPDSYGYIMLSAQREPLYPLFINFFKIILPSTLYLKAIVLFQTILTCLAFYFSSYTVRTSLKLSKLISYLAVLPLLIYLLSPNFWPAHILSEGLSIPLFVSWFNALILFETKKTRKYFFIMLILTSLLMLTRPQFYFLPGIFILIIAREFISKKLPFKKTMLVFFMVLTTLATLLISKTYHKIVNHQFESSPTVGLQLMVRPMMLATHKDANIFNDNPVEKQIFIRAEEKMEKQHYTISNFQQIPVDNIAVLYEETDNNPYGQVVSDLYSAYTSEFPGKSFFSANGIMDDMAWKLYKNDPIDIMHAYGSDVIKFGIARSFRSDLTLTIILLILSGFFMIKNNNIFCYIIFWGEVFMVLNIMFISIFEPLLIRYLVYNYALFVFSSATFPLYLIIKFTQQEKACVE